MASAASTPTQCTQLTSSSAGAGGFLQVRRAHTATKKKKVCNVFFVCADLRNNLNPIFLSTKNENDVSSFQWKTSNGRQISMLPGEA